MPSTYPTPVFQEKVAQTLLAYYRQTDQLVPTADELASWFDALAAPLRLQMHTLGLQVCLRLPPFQRYVLEKRGVSLPAYMAAHLTAEELAHWAEEGDGHRPLS